MRVRNKRTGDLGTVLGYSPSGQYAIVHYDYGAKRTVATIDLDLLDESEAD